MSGLKTFPIAQVSLYSEKFLRSKYSHFCPFFMINLIPFKKKHIITLNNSRSTRFRYQTHLTIEHHLVTKFLECETVDQFKKHLSGFFIKQMYGALTFVILFVEKNRQEQRVHDFEYNFLTLPFLISNNIHI